MTSRKNAVAVLTAVLFIGCLLGASGVWLWGQRPQSPADTGSPHVQYEHYSRIIDSLRITSEQEAQLREILEDSRRRILASRAELQEEMDAIRADTNDRIAAILDANQKRIFDSLIEEAGTREGGGRHGGRGRRTNGH